MGKSTTALETPLRQHLDRLAACEPSPFPVVSLYLNLRTDQHGQHRHDTFLRKALPERGRTFPTGSPERRSYDTDVERIHEYLDGDDARSAQALALFAADGAGMFEAYPLAAPLDAHALYVSTVPHLYPLARLNDQYPRYAALLVDTNAARLFVFSLAAAERRAAVQNTKTRRSQIGGWSQARFQRHHDNLRDQHIKEVVDLLDRVVRTESIDRIVIACDEVTRPRLLEQMPKSLAEKVVDRVHLDIHAPEHEVLTQTLEALRGRDLLDDQAHVDALLDAWRAGGLASVGPEDTLLALEIRQVEELLISARPDALPGTQVEQTSLANQLVAKAQQCSARIRFIEDPDLLRAVGGCGALLRFKVDRS